MVIFIKRKMFWWVLVAVWCSVIFVHSNEPAAKSEQRSYFFVTAINRLISRAVGKSVTVITDRMVRKTAHCIEYLILGSLLYGGFFRDRRFTATFFLTLIAGLAYALSDEIHQHFVPGRTMRVSDVFIDFLGIFLGAVLMHFHFYKKERGINRNQSTTS